MTDLPLLFRALDLAAQRHRTQRRKGAHAPPYVNHLLDVVRRLVDAGITDAEVLAAAALHDTVEDTEYAPDALRAAFGDRVADLVLAVTDDKTLAKPERKRRQVEKAPTLPRDAQRIKLADKASNVREIALDPPADWPHARRVAYLDWAAEVVSGLRGADPALERAFDAELAAARAAFGTG